MSDLQKYITKRKAADPEFAENFESGYEEFKIGTMLKMAREEAGYTQEELAEKLHTKKSTLSRIDSQPDKCPFRLSCIMNIMKPINLF